jgi:2-dehydro-3-deoxyphosphooctonate aldolase (KDO 8-P synthase)
MLPDYFTKYYNKNYLSKLLLIAGPCVVENRSVIFETCEELKKITDKLKIPFIFKSSYAKANRTSSSSFRSIGFEKALKILSDVKKEFDVPVLTDVHTETEIDLVSDYVDILQIPAFLSRQTEFLEHAGKTGKIINIKKGQFLSPNDFKYQAEKIKAVGNNKILLTERGSCFGYNNLIVDFRSFPIMKSFGYPVIFDATHSLQIPSGNKGVSGGTPEYIEPMAKAAVAAGIDGIFIETHPNPSKALSDGSNMLKLDKVENLLLTLIKIHNTLN